MDANLPTRNGYRSAAALPRINPTSTQAWFLLKKHFEEEMNRKHMRDLFAAEPERFQKFSLCLEDLVFDYSKNIINQKTLKLLLELAEDCKLKDAIKAMFDGDKINETEGRAVLHTALRNFSGNPVMVDGKDIMPDILKVQEQTTESTKRIHRWSPSCRKCVVIPNTLNLISLFFCNF